MTSDQEILDVVDLQDNVISKAPRDYVHNHSPAPIDLHMFCFLILETNFFCKNDP